MSKLNNLISAIEALDIPDSTRRSLTCLAVEVYNEAFREASLGLTPETPQPQTSPDFATISDQAFNNQWAKENFIQYLANGDYEIR